MDPGYKGFRGLINFQSEFHDFAIIEKKFVLKNLILLSHDVRIRMVSAIKWLGSNEIQH